MPRILLAVPLLLGLAACSQTEQAPPLAGPAAKGRVIEVKKGTVYPLEGARIAAGWIRKGEYVDDAGAAKSGLVAGLTILLPGDSPTEQSVSAYAGKIFQAGKHMLRVEELAAGGSGWVRLRVLEPAAK
ncbi:MAG: hypothetical protein ABIJ96_03825 [Elusimicrobiota bacterium]